jgi:hypothetical protein
LKARINRAVAIGFGLTLALGATPVLATGAAATEYTGWQTNSGWNSLEGCKTYRTIFSDGVSVTDYNLCALDVGAKGQVWQGTTAVLLPWDWDYRTAGYRDYHYAWRPLVRAAHE